MHCTLCRHGEVTFTRPYSGERLCRECFLESIETRARKTMSKYQMFKEDDKIAVAVSGGKDSLTLLHLLHKIERGFPRAKMFVVTVDEGIPDYRDEALKIAEQACCKLGLEHVVVSFEELYGYTIHDVAEKVGDKKGELTPCSYCGVLRRRALNKVARELKATKLATAHNLDDEVQTILINVVHGDIFRVARVEPVTTTEIEKMVRRVKPLCEIPENEITLYAYLRNITFQSSECPHAPSALRTEIRDFVNRLEARHPGVKYTIYRSFERLRPTLKAVSKMELKKCQACGEPSVDVVCETCRMTEKLGKSLQLSC